MEFDDGRGNRGSSGYSARADHKHRVAPIVTWTPVVTQGVTPTQTLSGNLVRKSERRVTAQAAFAFTTAGTAATRIQLILPYNVPTFPMPIGEFSVLDAGVTLYGGVVRTISASACCFLAGTYPDFLGVNPAYTIGNGDTLELSLDYFSV